MRSSLPLIADPRPHSRPHPQSRTPLYLAIALAATLSWGGFISYATNNERANSSVVRSLSFQLRASDEVARFLGGKVRTPPLFGEFRIVRGSVSLSHTFFTHQNGSTARSVTAHHRLPPRARLPHPFATPN